MSDHPVPFSQRIGLVPPPALQLDGMTSELRASLWNYLRDTLGPRWVSSSNALAIYFFRIEVETVPSEDWLAAKWLQNRFSKLPWNRAYEFVEFVVRHLQAFDPAPSTKKFVGGLNWLLEREHAGFRFVGDTLVPITDEVELAAVQQALTAKDGVAAAREHIHQAAILLGKRPDPDYRNSVKESISAIESFAKTLGIDKKGLADPLEELGKRLDLHQAMRAGFVKLYAYTSDAAGIRHALLDDSKPVGLAEAHYMLVACSAFLNFLVMKASEAGLLQSSKTP
ncbi:MAG TPA: hypothetical protein VLI06_00285 [Solimonas sp.]|nr:hypothetical protein [Solimonas sp.]